MIVLTRVPDDVSLEDGLRDELVLVVEQQAMHVLVAQVPGRPLSFVGLQGEQCQVSFKYLSYNLLFQTLFQE